MREKSRKQVLRYNPVAKDLRTSKYSQRIKQTRSPHEEKFSLEEELKMYEENNEDGSK